ncbi:coiled-coil domain-containing protein 144B-like [Perognathus longimembris pacificus]|uniref:coiled-coil domain-containing protein 144B-like n=1 Tax=Perognathus longimembris pacificus TaxID=214514 RepID=UPI002018D521|nr:coiled-coil domain-containing protein 144B-like [Perognathus longimembris pacificus]
MIYFQVKNEITTMSESDDFTLSSEITCGGWELSGPDCDDILVLLKQLRLKYNDPGRILKIQDTLHAYKKVLKLKCSHYEVLKEKTEHMRKNISILHKELSEEEHAKVEQEQELRNLRLYRNEMIP